MAQTYPKTFENCSTCNFWDGKREINASGTQITVKSPATMGSCEFQKGEDKVAYMYCPNWSEINS
ncbi:MAG: hypothetical protein JKY19_14015 [Alcanivoracaceae bacterium]|nr:hypothetical protein [Alcanivoracaceae bacterium]